MWGDWLLACQSWSRDSGVQPRLRIGPPASWGRRGGEKGPLLVLEPLKEAVLMEGSAAKLMCRISVFPTQPWSKDDKELREGPEYRQGFEDPDIVVLVVRASQPGDLGQYSISVTNCFGQCSDSACILVEGTCLGWRKASAHIHPTGARQPGAVMREYLWACPFPFQL